MAQKAEALIVMLDSTACDEEQCRLLDTLIRGDDDLAKLPMLVYCNKQDLSAAKSVVQLTTALNLTALRNRQW